MTTYPLNGIIILCFGNVYSIVSIPSRLTKFHCPPGPLRLITLIQLHRS